MTFVNRLFITKKLECSYSKKAEELKAVSLASAIETVEKLEVKLAEFAKKHKHDIQQDPAFRSKFLEMCSLLGEHIVTTVHSQNSLLYR